MIWYDLIRSTTFWYDLVRFGTISPSLSGTVRAYQNTCEHIRVIGVSYRELSPAEITNTSLHAATDRPRSPAETVTRKEITFDPINFLTMHFFNPLGG